MRRVQFIQAAKSASSTLPMRRSLASELSNATFVDDPQSSFEHPVDGCCYKTL
jgi:hypothetical protein